MTTIDDLSETFTHPTDSGPVTHPAQLPDGNPGLVGIPLTIAGAVG